MNRKVIVIGLDGATWDILRPWAEEGKLPCIREMMEKGTWGQLRSTLPPITGPAWVSCATGKNPGKHGCYDFVLPRHSLGKLEPITTRDIKGKTFYEILDENGRKCIIVNLPVSYPPRLKEVIITSLLTQGDSFIFPPELVAEVPELSSYRILPNMSLRLNNKRAAYIEDITKVEETRFECTKKLFVKSDCDFLFLLFGGTDWIQHVMYGELVSKNLDENPLAAKLYRVIDEYIGWLTANAPPGTNILLMSDHGFKAYEKSFYINEWLRQKGYLITEPRTKPSVPRTRGQQEIMGLTSKKKALSLPNFLASRRRLLNMLAPFYRVMTGILPFRVQTYDLQPRIPQTTALSTFSVTNVGGIYINDKRRFADGKVEVSDYEDIRNQIIGELKGLVDTKTGKRVVSEIWNKEEVYSGAQLDIGPDIVFISNEYLADISLSGKLFAYQKDNRHALDGIFLAYGPDIKDAAEVQGAGIYDIAPTILHMFGLPVPDDMDGRVLTEIFREDSEPAQREVKYQKIDTESENIKDKIRKLKARGII